MPSISRPTLPVAPTTATLKPIVNSPSKLFPGHGPYGTGAEALLSEKAPEHNVLFNTLGGGRGAGRAFPNAGHPRHSGAYPSLYGWPGGARHRGREPFQGRTHRRRVHRAAAPPMGHDRTAPPGLRADLAG